MNEFEKYPELTECLQEYAAYGKFNSWSGFIASLNKALTRETPHESQPDPAITDQELAEEAEGLNDLLAENSHHP